MATIITETFELPAHWLPALINDDTSHMTDQEVARLDRFIKHQLEVHQTFNVVGCGEPYFSGWHDARDFGELPSEVCECEVQVAAVE